LLRAVNTDYTAATGGAVNGTSQVVNAGDTPVDSGQLVCAGITRPATMTVTNDWMNVAGTYTFTFWEDLNSDGVKDAGENLSRTGSITVGGAPTSITVTPQTLIGSEDRDYAVWVYLKDAAGNATKLVAGEELSARIDNNTGSPMDTLLLDDDASSAGGVAGATALNSTPSLEGTTSYHLYTFNASHSAAFTNGSVKISVNFGGTIAPLATAASASVAILDTNSALSMMVKAGQAGIAEDADSLFAFPAPVVLNEDDFNEIFANPLQALSIVYTIVGAPNTYVDVTIDNNGGTAPTGVLPTGITTKTEPVLLGTDGTKDYTVTATAAAVGNTYSISSGDLEFDVTYNAAGVNVATNSIAEMPTGVTKVLTAVGGTSTFNVTVADDYDNKYTGYFVRLTTSSTSRNASKTVTVKSGTNGLATLSLADAGTTGTDTATISVFAPDDTVTAVQTWTATITYAANVSGSLSVGGGSTAVTDFKAYVAAHGSSTFADLDTSDGTPSGTDEACVAITHVLRDSTLAPLTGYAARFTGVTPGIRFLTSIDNQDCSTGNDYWGGTAESVFSHANNQTIVYALASKTGVNEVKIEAGGYTQTIKFTAITDTSFARHLTLTSPTSPTRQGSGAMFTATVTDGFNNVIQGANVTFSVVAGRSLSGASAALVPTDANGKASLSLTSDTDGTVSLTATLSGAQTGLGAGVPVAEFKKYAAPAAGTATIDGISLAAESAQTAADAAAEATDAANAATDAANAAAEAADAATAAAQDAADAVAALATSVEAMVRDLKRQITALTNLVIKIQRKVRA
jgi:trimeric autotransporter adhesin